MFVVVIVYVGKCDVLFQLLNYSRRRFQVMEHVIKCSSTARPRESQKLIVVVSLYGFSS